MPPEPSVTSACEGPRSCTLRYSSELLPKSFERPGPKSVSPATYCSGVEVVVWWRWIVDMYAPFLGDVASRLLPEVPWRGPAVEVRGSERPRREEPQTDEQVCATLAHRVSPFNMPICELTRF